MLTVGAISAGVFLSSRSDVAVRSLNDDRYYSISHTFSASDNPGYEYVELYSHNYYYGQTGRYFNGFISDGTLNNDGITLPEGEFFQADLKGAVSVNITFEGVFAIELSNDNVNFTSRKYLTSGEEYTFNTPIRYVRVLSKDDEDDSCLKGITLYYECSENYVFDTAPKMSESHWTSTVKANKYTLVGNQKGDNIDDFNYLTIYATRDSRGIHVFCDEKVTGGLAY